MEVVIRFSGSRAAQEQKPACAVQCGLFGKARRYPTFRFLPIALHARPTAWLFLSSRLMRRLQLLCAMGRSVQAMMRIALRSERRASLRFHPK